MAPTLEEIQALINENTAILSEKPRQTVKFSKRSDVLYSLITSRNDHLYPSVHLWEPDRATLMRVVLEWEPNLTGESFYIAVHGHKATEQCGLKNKWTQLCHMAFYKPEGVETENFHKKWSYLYEPDSDVKDSPCITRVESRSFNQFGEGGIRLGGLDFVVGKDFTK